MPDHPKRISTPTLIIGVPGSGKTSLLGTFAEYIFETYDKKVLLLYSWDGGAIPTNVQRLVKFGLIRFWRVRTRSAEGLGIETLLLASKGYWPRKINPVTGETSPAIGLVPAITAIYTVTCRKTGEIVTTLPVASIIQPTYCTACKTLHPLADLNIAETVKRTRGFEQVGGVAFDGLTSLSSVVLEHMDHSRGQGQIGGEKSAFGGTVVSGSMKLGGNNRADIGFGQTRAKEVVHNSMSIPDLVEAPVFTALAMEASDEGGLPIVGAKLPGRAATDEASSWCGNVFETGRTTDTQGREHFTLFLRPYTDAQNRRHLLKTSASPTGLPDMLVDPIDQPWTQANLGLVFKLLDADLAEAMARDIPGAPGLEHTPSEYGETFQVQTPPSVPTVLTPSAPDIPTLPLAPPLAPPPAPPLAAGPTPVPPAGNGPTPPVAPPVMARKRPKPQPLDLTTATAPTPANPTMTTPTLMTMTPMTPMTTTTPEPVAPPRNGPPPPPGMKPAQRLPDPDAQS
jgi:hypothetical protein